MYLYEDTIPVSTPYNSKKGLNQDKIKYYQNKMNKYYSYGASITTPTNSKMKSNTNENDPSSILSPNQDSNNNSKKYIKKLNVKSYQQKLNEIQNCNSLEKKEMYGKIFEREKAEEKISLEISQFGFKNAFNSIKYDNSKKEIITGDILGKITIWNIKIREICKI